MKILHVTTHIGQGGDWSVIKNLADIFSKNGHQIIIAGANINSDKYPSIEMPLNEGKIGFLKALKQIDKIPHDLDVLHAHSPITLFLSLIIKIIRCRKAKVIFTYHWLIINTSFKKKIKSLLFNAADIVQCHAIDVHDFLCSEYGLKEDKCKLVYVGVDTKRFSLIDSDDKLLRKEQYQISDEKFVLLYAGRLAPEKNIPSILKYLKETSKDVVLLIAGDGGQRPDLEQLVKQFNISNRVKFLGKISDIESAYAVSDLLLLPSSSMETFGMVVIEAALCGLPTLRSDLPGAIDQIDHEYNGFIFPKDEPRKMNTIIDAACDGQYDLKIMGERACNQAKEKFSLEAMYAGFIELYSQ